MPDKRIIAIQVSPRAYDEIQMLRGERTWTKYLLELMTLENPQNEVLTAELLELGKPKTERPKAEEKPAKIKGIKAETTELVKGGVAVDLSKIGKHKEIEAEV